jgi:ribonuclease HI
MLALPLKSVRLYTEGSCPGGRGPGGWAAILVWEKHEREFFGVEKYSTRNRIELVAVIEGLRQLKQICRVAVTCHSRYVVDAFNEYRLEEWRRSKWRMADGKPVMYQALWRELLVEHAKHDVHSWTLSREHADDPYVGRCHRLALRESRAPGHS